MSKKKQENFGRPSAPSATAVDASRSRKGQGGAVLPWHPVVRWVVSLLVVVHLLAVFAAPWDLSTGRALPPGYLDSQGRPLPPPPPESAVWQKPHVTRALRKFFGPYLDLCYLNHGYQFFAPDPGGSHLIRWRIWDAAGAEIAQGEFPDLKEQWPRLFYHRHMMLAAQTGDMGEESGHGYARHLLQKHGGKTIRLQWVFHQLLPGGRVLEGTPLDDPSTYLVLAEIDEVAKQPSASPAGEPAIAIPGGAW